MNGRLGKLNEQGLRAFRDFLRDARNAPGAPPSVPALLLTLPQTSEAIDGGALELEDLDTHTTGFGLAQYLHQEFERVRIDVSVIEGDDGLGDPGFWGALGLRYFELLTPGYRTGKATVKADNCYIPEIGTTMAGVRYFRHRIAGAYRLYRQYKDLSRPFLLSQAGEQSVLYTKITDSFFYTQTRCLIEAINELYFDSSLQRLKDGWNAKNEPGTLPRLLAIVNQFDLTYDLLALDGPTLIDMLPSEFDVWRKPARAAS